MAAPDMGRMTSQSPRRPSACFWGRKERDRMVDNLNEI
jgi:hypothetical protein